MRVEIIFAEDHNGYRTLNSDWRGCNMHVRDNENKEINFDVVAKNNANNFAAVGSVANWIKHLLFHDNAGEYSAILMWFCNNLKIISRREANLVTNNGIN